MIKIGVTDDNYRPFLHTAHIDHIIGSIKYYVDTYGIRYKSTIETFYSALTVFFQYIQVNDGIRNEYFVEGNKIRELKSAIDAQAKDLELNEKEQAYPLSNDECERLIALCNEKLDIPSKEEIIHGANNGVYTFFLSSLIVKFVLLFGLKNKEIMDLRLNSYNRVLNKMQIRGYSVHLPDNLAIQMKKYIEIRDEIISTKYQSDRLFVDIVPEQKLDNAKMFSALKAITGNSKAMTVSKYAIIQMMKKGVPFGLVMDFTGYAKDVCGHCQELVDEENGVFQLSEKNKILDSAFRQSKLFDNL